MWHLALARVMGFCSWRCTSIALVACVLSNVMLDWLIIFQICVCWVNEHKACFLLKSAFSYALIIYAYEQYLIHMFCTNGYFFPFPQTLSVPAIEELFGYFSRLLGLFVQVVLSPPSSRIVPLIYLSCIDIVQETFVDSLYLITIILRPKWQYVLV